jgi:hypothetical protein
MRALLGLLLVACGGVAEPTWQEVGPVRLSETEPGQCWYVEGPNRATTQHSAQDVEGGGKIWPGGAELIVWADNGSTDVDPLNYTLVDCD